VRIPAIAAVACALALVVCGCGKTPNPLSSSGSGAAPASAGATGSVLTGFAFVDSSVTSQGSQAKLPGGSLIYPPGTTFTGSTGCPTNKYHTDGMIVAVIDYNGRPTAASLTVIRHPVSGGSFTDAPYYLDLNPGRTLQTLGPIFDNGSYDVLFTWDYNQGAGNKATASFTFSRNCTN